MADAAGAFVRVIELTKRYASAAAEVTALDRITREFAPGISVALMGSSGCGKTSLLNLLGGVDRATSGSIIVDQLDLGRLDERALESYRLRKVGYVFQFLNLIPSLTATENLELPMLVAGLSKDERRARAQQLLEFVGLRDKAAKRPEQLSGGEQQRVAISLALVNDPPLVLADEPTGNLDSANAAVVTDLLASLAKRGKTVIVATHDANVAQAFSCVYLMRDGQFI